MDSSSISISLLVVFLSILHSTNSLRCMSCTYTFSGTEGITDRQCVTDVYNFTKTSIIDCELFCTTKAVYVSGYTRLNSLYRGCGYKREKFCDNPASLVPTCEVTCTSDECNNKNGDLWPSMKPHGGGGGGGGDGNGSSNLNVSFYILFLVALFKLFAYVTFRRS